jgi:hypothetical protein
VLNMPEGDVISLFHLEFQIHAIERLWHHQQI